MAEASQLARPSRFHRRSQRLVTKQACLRRGCAVDSIGGYSCPSISVSLYREYSFITDIGIMLIVLSRGITLRVKRAYSWTLLLLCTGAIFTFANAFDYEEAIILLVIALLLWMSRQQFYRLSVPLRKYHIIGWMIITACIAGVYYFIGASTRPFLKKPFHFHVGEHAPKLLGSSAFILSAVSGLLLAWLLLTLYYLLRPKQLNMPSISNVDHAKLSDFLEQYPGNMLTHMLFSGDKGFFWAMDIKC
ncbi:hypothetical protein [Paenibacillus lutimineralis]|uniref:hypothetical protein n=1 Tax=Paenibacillus lutimineralis TaxID=2707005 RepID=UPI001D04A572|nr:hypothetical protein [Paenibacillus lutimineralis]